MVKELEDNNGVLNINELNTQNTNGNSYADSLKLDLKRKQPTTINNNLNNFENDNNYLETNELNGNGILNEFVVNVSSNKSTLSSNNKRKSLNNQFNDSLNNIFKSENDNEEINSTETINNKTTETISTKQILSKSNDNMKTFECSKKKIKVQLQNEFRLDEVDVLFYISNIIKDTLDVDFKDQSLSFKFKTTDSNFLKSHQFNDLEKFRNEDGFTSMVTKHRITNGTINGKNAENNKFTRLNPNQYDVNKLPLFEYKINKLFDKIIPNECTVQLTDKNLKLTLKKKVTIKWHDLEFISSDMCIDFLKNKSTVQKEDNNYKYKSFTNTNVNKLINGYEKTINSKSIKDDNKKEKQQLDNKLQNNAENSNEIPLLESPKKTIKTTPVKQEKQTTPTKQEEQDEQTTTPIKQDEQTTINNSFSTTAAKEESHNILSKLFISIDEDEKKKDDDITKKDDDITKKVIPLSYVEALESKPEPVRLKLNFAEMENLRIGYTGLNNLGNTCYMNSCLQCLSNTIELRDYFLNEEYRDDLNKSNPFGSGGNLAESFSDVLYNLWSGQSSSFSPSKFKRLIDQNCSQFMGYSQHDSVEFMEHFLDVLHEDLNKVDRKNLPPATAIENEDKLSDEELANEQWKRHQERNNSIITQLFYGQYKSKLVCPKCSKVSITFDPFLYLPIPLTKNKITYNLYLFQLNNEEPKRFSCKLPQSSKFSDILEYVSSKTNIPRFSLKPCIINQNNELDNEYRQNSAIPDNIKFKKIFIFQTPENRETNKFVVHQSVPDLQSTSYSIFLSSSEKCGYCNRLLNKMIRSNLKRCKCKKITYCDEKCLQNDLKSHKQKCIVNDSVLVGWPSFFFCDLETITYEELINNLEKQALNSVDVNEKEIEEEEEEEKEEEEDSEMKEESLDEKDEDKLASKDETDNLHIGHEIKEGQEFNQTKLNKKIDEKDEINCEDEKSTTDKNYIDDVNKLETSIEEDKDESMDTDTKSNNSTTSLKAKKSEEDNGYRFILRGKTTDITRNKDEIYVPKDTSDEEQNKFRKSITNYYFLYVDWKEKYSKIDDDGKRRKFSLNVQSKNLNYVASNYYGDSNSFNNYDQEKADCTLENLMTKFTEPETLSAQEAWVCPNCKEPRTASKELTIWRPPKYLIIQLKRFSYSSYIREKIDKLVDYPLKGLDISKFCSDPKLSNMKPIYDLYAIIDHFGGLYGGHYTANATTSVNGKNLGWRAFNDSSVRDIDEESISRHAYVLFYRLNSENQD